MSEELAIQPKIASPVVTQLENYISIIYPGLLEVNREYFHYKPGTFHYHREPEVVEQITYRSAHSLNNKITPACDKQEMAETIRFLLSLDDVLTGAESHEASCVQMPFYISLGENFFDVNFVQPEAENKEGVLSLCRGNKANYENSLFFFIMDKLEDFSKENESLMRYQLSYQDGARANEGDFIAGLSDCSS